MKNLVDKFPKLGELVFDLFSDTFQNTKECLELPQNRRFASREVDLEWFAASTKALFEM